MHHTSISVLQEKCKVYEFSKIFLAEILYKFTKQKSNELEKEGKYNVTCHTPPRCRSKRKAWDQSQG